MSIRQIEDIFLEKLVDWKVVEKKSNKYISFSIPFEREEIVFEGPSIIPSMGLSGVIKTRANQPSLNKEMFLTKSIEIAKREMKRRIPPYLKYNEDEISVETITIKNRKVINVVISLYIFPGITAKVRSIIIPMEEIIYVAYGLYENAEVLANILIENMNNEIK